MKTGAKEYLRRQITKRLQKNEILKMSFKNTKHKYHFLKFLFNIVLLLEIKRITKITKRIRVAVKDCIFSLNSLRNINGLERCGYKRHAKKQHLLLLE